MQNLQQVIMQSFIAKFVEIKVILYVQIWFLDTTVKLAELEKNESRASLMPNLTKLRFDLLLLRL